MNRNSFVPLCDWLYFVLFSMADMEERMDIMSQSLFLMSSSAAASQIPEYVVDSESSEDDDDGHPECHYGVIRGAIVGVQYYRGTVSTISVQYHFWYIS
jgi:hypothetical protein